MNTNRDMIQTIQDSIPDGWITDQEDSLRAIVGGTYDATREIIAMMGAVKNATSFEDQSAALSALRLRFTEITGGFESGSDAAKEMLAQIVEAEDASIRLAKAQEGSTDATSSGSKAAADLRVELDAGADAAFRLLQTMANVPAGLALMGRGIADQIAGLERANKSLNLQIGGNLSAVAADRTVQLQDMVAAGAKSGNLNFDEVARRSADIARLNSLSQEGARLQKQLSDSMKSPGSGGGGGAGRQSDLERYNQSLAQTLDSLRAQEIAQRAVADSTFKSDEAARAYAEAVLLMGGNVDKSTLAILRQIDAQAEENASLEKLANHPAHNALKNSFEEMFRTAEFSAKNFADSMISALSSVLADQTTKAFLSLFDGLGQGNGGGFMGGLLGWLFPAHAEGGYSDGRAMSYSQATIAQFQHAPAFAAGTANTSGIPAVLHPNEAVIPLTKGRKVPVELGGDMTGGGSGGNTVAFTGDIHVTTNVQTSGDLTDPKEAAKLSGVIGDMVTMRIRDQLARELAYGGILNPR